MSLLDFGFRLVIGKRRLQADWSGSETRTDGETQPEDNGETCAAESTDSKTAVSTDGKTAEPEEEGSECPTKRRKVSKHWIEVKLQTYNWLEYNTGM